MGSTICAARPRRRDQVMGRLMAGDSERQIATRLGLSKHTVHVYIKELHRMYHAHSRGELLAKAFRQRSARPSRHRPKPASHAQWFAPGC